MKVTLVKDDFTDVSWFYMLREIGLASNELLYEEIFDNYGEILPEYESLFKYDASVILEVSSYKVYNI